MKTIYIGVAWPYSYAAFHVGNLYGSHYPADIFARFHKLQGNRVVMVSGSDCHGTPITLAADKVGITPQELAKKYHEVNTALLEDLHIEYSLFTTTATDNHRMVVQEMFLRLLDQGKIVKETTKQLYSAKQDRFMQDRYVEGECPHCHSDGARGDQCESCGRVLDALELINPVAKGSDDALVVKETENYFIDLEAIQPQLEDWLKTKEGTWSAWILAETRGWFKDGLQKRAITRDMSYGISLPHDKIPEDKKLINAEKKVFYVWFEAVIGYLSATVEYLGESYKDVWFDDDAEHYYFVGEDNLVFHTINWPAQLMATGKGYHLPDQVFVNKFLMLEGKKISKSANWIIDTREMLEHYSLDTIRFYLAYIMTGHDQTNFQWEDFLNVNNGVFLAKIGNLINRVLAFSKKNFGDTFAQDEMEVDGDLRKAVEKAFQDTASLYGAGKVREAVLTIVELAETGNEYLTKHEFWKLIKEDEEACKHVVASALHLVRALAILLYPVTPDMSKKLWAMLGYTEELQPEEGRDMWQAPSIEQGMTFAESISPLVTKLESEVVLAERERLGRQS